MLAKDSKSTDQLIVTDDATRNIGGLQKSDNNANSKRPSKKRDQHNNRKYQPGKPTAPIRRQGHR